jgi:aminoglycoside 6-adenylyltransferase
LARLDPTIGLVTQHGAIAHKHRSSAFVLIVDTSTDRPGVADLGDPRWSSPSGRPDGPARHPAYPGGADLLQIGQYALLFDDRGLGDQTMTTADSMTDALAAWVLTRRDVRAMLLLGSQARSDHPADEFSDIDVVLTVDDPDVFLRRSDWLRELGDVIADVVEPTAIGGMSERRVLFGSGQDVDFSVVPLELMKLLGDFSTVVEVRQLLGRGNRVLKDDLGIRDAIDAIPAPDPGGIPVAEADYRALSNGFWYHLVWATKKWRRGELWVAMTSCEGDLSKPLVDLVRWRTQLRLPSIDIWHGNRYIEEWADSATMIDLAATRTGYGVHEIGLSLRRLANLFRQLEADCREITGFAPAVDEERLWQLFERLLARPPD